MEYLLNDRGRSLITFYSLSTGITLIFLVLRFWSRLRFGGVSWDDYFMVISWVFFVVLTVLVSILAENGGFNHAYNLDPAQSQYVLKINYISRPFGLLPLLTVKIAVGFLIFRILRGAASKRLVYGLWSLLALNTLIGILDIIFTFAQCKNPAALWTPAIQSQCWSTEVKTVSSVTSASSNVLVDFVLAVTPAVKIWKLKLSLRKRLGLIALFGSGLLSVISASIKTYELAQSTKPQSDPTWAGYSLYAWTSAEILIIHFCASIPTYKPLWEGYKAQKHRATYSNQGYKLPYTTANSYGEDHDMQKLNASTGGI
ncbi:hypothetical protein F4803DRAFT_556614 [Xylaria telfairii]|nr:hypothetical protein F4803DRAFT_556614 [Xylaria telfairii]